MLFPPQVKAATSVQQRADKLSTSQPSATSTHEFSFIMSDTSQPVGSISLQFCSNTPVIDDGCTASNGLDLSGTTLTSQNGDTGFSVAAGSPPGFIILTRSPSNPAGVLSTYTLDGIVNPSDLGSHYVRIRTYSSIDASGVDIQNGGVVYVIVPGFDISSEVPPYLRFCVATVIISFDCATALNYFVDLGDLSTTSTKSGTSQFLAATNAVSGYSVTVAGTTLTSGTFTIPAVPVPTSSNIGTGQFGINLRSNTVPSVGADTVGAGTATPAANYSTANNYKFTSNDVVAGVTHSDDNRKFTVSYITNIDNAQAAGVYATTISFICLANF